MLSWHYHSNGFRLHLISPKYGEVVRSKSKTLPLNVYAEIEMFPSLALCCFNLQRLDGLSDTRRFCSSSDFIQRDFEDVAAGVYLLNTTLLINHVTVLSKQVVFEFLTGAGNPLSCLDSLFQPSFFRNTIVSYIFAKAV